MTQTIYLISQSTDEDDERPDGVTYYDPHGEFKRGEGFERFQKNCCISAGKEKYLLEDWITPQLFASRPGTTAIEAWDYYLCATFGAFSQRAIDILLPAFGDRFVPLAATLEGRSYFCLHCKRRIDCLDNARSDVIYFGDGTSEAMTIDRYAFHMKDLSRPSIFAIPQLTFRLYCTDDVRDMAAAAGLKGLDFISVYSE
ncbi:MAG TPA: DUF1629 domain-containing protein [Schlesneria sp.]